MRSVNLLIVALFIFAAPLSNAADGDRPAPRPSGPFGQMRVDANVSFRFPSGASAYSRSPDQIKLEKVANGCEKDLIRQLINLGKSGIDASSLNPAIADFRKQFGDRNFDAGKGVSAVAPYLSVHYEFKVTPAAVDDGNRPFAITLSSVHVRVRDVRAAKWEEYVAAASGRYDKYGPEEYQVNEEGDQSLLDCPKHNLTEIAKSVIASAQTKYEETSKKDKEYALLRIQGKASRGAAEAEMLGSATSR